MKATLLLAAVGSLCWMACGPSGQKAMKDANASTTQVADALDDISKTIRTVQETANQVKTFSENMAVTGERVKGIQGVELLGNSGWEYKVVDPDADTPEALEASLNELGKDGWELTVRSGNNRTPYLIFKRRKQ